MVTLGLSTLPYPFLPRHLSLASSFAIGIPAFLLALAPSAGRWRPVGFLREVARFAVPAGLACLVGALCLLLGAGYVAMLLFPPTRRFFALSAPEPAIVALSAAAIALGSALARVGARRAASEPVTPPAVADGG